MKLYRALREKNVLVGKLKSLSMKIHNNNTKIVGNEFDYNIRTLMDERDSIMDGLIQLKLQIQKATEPMVNTIYTLAELKSKSQMLQSIPTQAGVITERYGDTQTEKERVLSPNDIEVLRTSIDKRIGKLQDELDIFNHQTDI